LLSGRAYGQMAALEAERFEELLLEQAEQEAG